MVVKNKMNEKLVDILTTERFFFKHTKSMKQILLSRQRPSFLDIDFLTYKRKKLRKDFNSVGRCGNRLSWIFQFIKFSLDNYD